MSRSHFSAGLRSGPYRPGAVSSMGRNVWRSTPIETNFKYGYYLEDMVSKLNTQTAVKILVHGVMKLAYNLCYFGWTCCCDIRPGADIRRLGLTPLNPV